MSIEKSRERIRARVWQSIAQSDLEFESVDKEQLESLVNLVTEAALLEIDDQIDQSVAADDEANKLFYPQMEEDGEEVLWQGKPFLSLSEHYVITNERIRIVRGLLGKERQDIELIRVQDIDQSQTLRERTLNLGDITIQSHDRATPTIVLNNIRDPEKVHEILRKAVQNIRRKHKMTFQEEM
ncbi:MAG: PH domain-containing protein [Chloroflexota bacterium]|jgi:hypothetical protein